MHAQHLPKEPNESSEITVAVIAYRLGDIRTRLKGKRIRRGGLSGQEIMILQHIEQALHTAEWYRDAS